MGKIVFHFSDDQSSVEASNLLRYGTKTPTKNNNNNNNNNKKLGKLIRNLRTTSNSCYKVFSMILFRVYDFLTCNILFYPVVVHCFFIILGMMIPL